MIRGIVIDSKNLFVTADHGFQIHYDKEYSLIMENRQL